MGKIGKHALRKAQMRSDRRPAPAKQKPTSQLQPKRTSPALSQMAVEVAGILDSEGRRWIEVRSGAHRKVILLEDIVSRPNIVFGDLAGSGIPLITDQSKRKFKELVEKIPSWAPLSIVTTRGVHDRCFVLSDTFVAAAPFTSLPHVAIKGDSKKWGAMGDLVEWQQAAKILKDQDLVIFCSSLAFVSPLLPLVQGFDNFGVELVSATSKGKSSLCKWVGSIWGGNPDSKLGFAESWLATVNALEGLMGTHSGCFVVLDESNFANAEHFEAIFRLSEGVSKWRHGDATPPKTNQFAWLSNGNIAIVDRLKERASAELSAAKVRLFTIPAEITTEYGIFNVLPEGVTDSGQLINLINEASNKFYGTPIRAFLFRWKLEMASWKTNKFRSLINSYVDAFVQATKIDRNDGAALRVARSFGLIYAAGRLARDWKVLPSDWGIGRAVMRCYRAHLSVSSSPAVGAAGRAVSISAPIQPTSALSHILEYVRQHRKDLLDLRAGKPRMTDEVFAQHAGFLRTTADGKCELLIPPLRMRQSFPKWLTLMRELYEQGHARVEQGTQLKLTTKVPIRSNKPVDRVYCVRLPFDIINRTTS